MSRARLLCAAAITTGALLGAPAVAGAAPTTLDDPSAGGRLTLCDTGLHTVRSGDTRTTPFVWRAVGATAPSGPYAGVGRTATLYAYQPRPQVPAAQWSGMLLTSSARYSSRTNPTAQATYGDTSLADYLTAFPTLDHGLVQLRLYLGAPQQPPYRARYDAVYLRISGHRWNTLTPGSASCHSGKAVSLETRVLPASLVKRPAGSGKAGSASGTGTGRASTNGTSGTPGTSTSSGTHASGAVGVRPAADQRGSSGGSNDYLIWLALGGAAVFGAAGALVQRRRSAPQPVTTTSASTARKAQS